MAKRDEEYGFSDFIDFIVHPFGPPEPYEDTWLTKIIDRAEISDPYANEPQEWTEVSPEELEYNLAHGIWVVTEPEPGDDPTTIRYRAVDTFEDEEW